MPTIAVDKAALFDALGQEYVSGTNENDIDLTLWFSGIPLTSLMSYVSNLVGQSSTDSKLPVLIAVRD